VRQLVCRGAIAALSALACGGNDLVLPNEAGTPAVITVVRGDDQSGAPGAPLADSIVVRVTDSAGIPVPGQLVVFTPATPGGAVAPQSATTGADGIAGAQWVLAPATGTQELVAQVISEGASSGLEVRFTASATTPSPEADRLALEQQPSSSARLDVPFDRQPVVQIRDRDDHNVQRSGIAVTAAVVSGGGSLGGTSTRLTDENGRAEFTDLRITGSVGTHVLIFAAEGHTSISAEPVEVRQVDAPPPPDNQPPIAANDEYNTTEGGDHTLNVGSSAGVLQNDGDPEGDPLSASDASDPPNGRVRLERDGSFSYTPEPSFYGDDGFTYRVSDASGASSTATVTIHVAPVNDEPRFRIKHDRVTVPGGETERTVSEFVKSITPGAPNETDQVLTFEVIENSNPGLFRSGPTVTRDGPDSETGTLRFTPAGQSGSATITLVLRDNGGTASHGVDTSDRETFTIRVE
jgi:Big-like domain-containing protein